MALTATNGMIAGVYSAWIAFRSSAGYPVGTCITPDSPTVNTVYSAYRLKYPVQFNPLNTQIAMATRKGGQRVRGHRYLPPDDIGSFTIVLDGKDEQFDAYVRGYTLDLAYNTSMAIGTDNSYLTAPPRFVLGMSLGFTDTDNATDYFMTYIWNNVVFTKAFGEGATQSSGTNPNPLEWTVTPDPSTRTGFGALYTATSLGVVEGTSLMVAIRDQYELTLSSYIANGSATTFATGFRGMSTDNTGAAGNIILKAGVITAVTSVAIGATKLVTLTGAGSSADHWDILYPTQYVA